MNIASVTRLPTAATSYYTVHKGQRKQKILWWVVLITPDGWQATTKLAGYATKEQAITSAARFAADTKRPFKLRGVVQ